MIRAAAEFWAVVYDHDRRLFSIHGPMGDASDLLRQAEARSAGGAEISCSVGHYGSRSDTKREVLRARPDYRMAKCVLGSDPAAGIAGSGGDSGGRNAQAVGDSHPQASQLVDRLEAFAPERPSQAEEMASDRAAIARVRADQPHIQQRLEASHERVEASKALIQATESMPTPAPKPQEIAELTRELECDEGEKGSDVRLRRVATPVETQNKQKTSPQD